MQWKRNMFYFIQQHNLLIQFTLLLDIKIARKHIAICLQQIAICLTLQIACFSQMKKQIL